jgi:hypothetical protein
MLLRVQKALYGTLIAGKLWFDKLTAALKKLGFTANPIDPCVMNKTYKGKQLTLCLFVDDILATCADKTGLTWIINQLKGLFDEVKGSISDDFSYLTGKIFWDFWTKKDSSRQFKTLQSLELS